MTVAIYNPDEPYGFRVSVTNDEPHTLAARWIDRRQRFAVYVCGCLWAEERVHLIFVANGFVFYEASERMDGTDHKPRPKAEAHLIGVPELLIQHIGIQPLQGEALVKRLVEEYAIPQFLEQVHKAKQQADMIKQGQWN